MTFLAGQPGMCSLRLWHVLKSDLGSADMASDTIIARFKPVIAEVDRFWLK